MHRILSLCFVAGFGASALRAAQKTPERDASARPPIEWVFSLAPKSLAKNPRLEFNVVTEMTTAGRERPEPSAAQPVFYVAQRGSYLTLGSAATEQKVPPPIDLLERIMREALATQHFLPAELPERPPAIAIIFHWGSFTVPAQTDEEIAAQFEAEAAGAPPAFSSDKSASEWVPWVLRDRQMYQQVIERAALVGGVPFAGELAKVLEEESLARLGNPAPGPTVPSGPFERFQNEKKERMQLVEDTFSSLYFVIISAFDHASLSQPEKVLLWRTKMTVNSLGVSMGETLPPLITHTAAFIGREMAGATTISKRIDREGSVEIGTPTVVEVFEDLPAAPAAPATDGR